MAAILIDQGGNAWPLFTLPTRAIKWGFLAPRPQARRRVCRQRN